MTSLRLATSFIAIMFFKKSRLQDKAIAWFRDVLEFKKGGVLIKIFCREPKLCKWGCHMITFKMVDNKIKTKSYILFLHVREEKIWFMFYKLNQLKWEGNQLNTAFHCFYKHSFVDIMFCMSRSSGLTDAFCLKTLFLWNQFKGMF